MKAKEIVQTYNNLLHIYTLLEVFTMMRELGFKSDDILTIIGNVLNGQLTDVDIVIIREWLDDHAK